LPIPVTTPADGAPPQSAYMPHPAHRPSSKKNDFSSMSLAMRSRAVSRPLACCRSLTLGPPPCSSDCSSRRTASTIPETSAPMLPLPDFGTLHRLASREADRKYTPDLETMGLSRFVVQQSRLGISAWRFRACFPVMG